MYSQTKHRPSLTSGLLHVALSACASLSMLGNVWAGATSGNNQQDTPPACSSPNCPTVSVALPTASLQVSDNPVSYKPPLGPAVDFHLIYNEFDPSHPANPAYSNVGPQWTTGWLAFITDNPTSMGSGVSLVRGEGGAAIYSGYSGGTSGTFAREERTGAILALVSTSPITYERRFPDGSKEVYSQSDGATKSPRHVFLTKKVDAKGNAVTFGYDATMRLVSVTDAIGQVTTLQYQNAANPMLITGVTDPFGRTAIMGYDSNGRLNELTDAIGMQSSFTYGTATGVAYPVITAMTTPYGTTNVTTWNDPNGGNHRWVTLTDPLGHTSKYEFMHGAPGIPFSESQTPTGMNLFNSYINYRNTFVWDGAAYAKASGDYTQAMIYHWLHRTDGLTSGTLESIKPPLETRTWYNYPGQPGTIYNGTLMQPSLTGRLLPDGKTQLTKVAYNTQGNPTSVIDPVGRTTTYGYDTNGIDLLSAQQKTATGTDTVGSLTYNAQHEPLTSKDAAGQVTTLTYNAQGQPLTVLDALGHKTTLTYDSKGYLTTVTDANNKVVQTLTYDSVGRVATRTDSEAYTVSYQYDNLDRVVKETYPDKTSRTITWDKQDVASVTDRLGRTTTYTHDAARNLTEMTDPLGRVTKYGYDEANRLVSLTDPAGKVTSWVRDIEGRVISKTLPDSSTTHYAYDTAGRLFTRTDALGQVTTYAYAIDNRSAGKAYSNAVNATSNVSVAWDNFYPRVTSMTDGTGATSYSYVPVGKLGALKRAGEVGPDGAAATIAYVYDELGRLSQRTVAGTAESFTYDTIGRISNDTNALGSFDYKYLGETGQTTSEQLTGSTVVGTYAYEDNLGDRRLKSIVHNALTLNYTSDAADRVLSRVGAAINDAYGYDQADRLTSVTSTSTTTTGGGGTGNCDDDDDAHHPGHHSDHDPHHDKLKGTRHECDDDHGKHHGHKDHDDDKRFAQKGKLGHDRDDDDDHYTSGGGSSTTTTSSVVDYTYDDADNLTGITGSKPFTATVNSGNQLDNVTDNGATSTWAYDANGNLLNDGINTYTWDAENRLLTLTNIASKAVSTFGYDGLSRRVSITDSGVQTKYLWCDEQICTARSAAGVLSARYFSQGELNGTTKRFYARDNIGSVMALLDNTGASKGAATYDAYGRVVSSSGETPAFAYAGMFRHAASGLYLTHYRAYSADAGRWISRDPIGEDGGLNLYAYVGANPTSYADPSGQFAQLALCLANPSCDVAVVEVITAIGSAITRAAAIVGVVSLTGDATRDKDPQYVVRGGMCTTDNFENGSGVTVDPSGALSGVSTQSAPGASIYQLSQPFMNNMVGVTTVEKIEAAGGTIVLDGTPANPNHATVNGLTSQQLETLFSPPIPNPVPKGMRGLK